MSVSTFALSTNARRAAASVVLSTALVGTMAACGSSDASEPAADPTPTSLGTLLDTKDHEGHQLRDLPAGEAPTIDLEVTADMMGGFNVYTATENFTFAPQHASGEAVAGEGHAHIYIDGEKYNRVYSNWFFIPADAMEEGHHEVTVALNGNDHNQYAEDGKPVEATVEVHAEEMGEHTH